MKKLAILPMLGLLTLAGCDFHRDDRIAEYNRVVTEQQQILGWSDEKALSEKRQFKKLKRGHQESLLRQLYSTVEKARREKALELEKKKQQEADARLDAEIETVKAAVSKDLIRNVIQSQNFKVVTSYREKELVVKALNYIKSQAAYKALGMDERSLKMMSGSLMKAGYDTSLAIGVAGKSPEEVKSFLDDCKSQLVREIRNP